MMKNVSEFIDLWDKTEHHFHSLVLCRLASQEAPADSARVYTVDAR
jgi:hypothetical protein